MIATFDSRLRIAFRTDASLEIGIGHVMRCLTLADALRKRGAECLFLCRPHAGHLLEQIAGRGHRALPLSAPRSKFPRSAADPVHGHWLGTDWADDAGETHEALGGEDIEWLVVDHYALDRRWELALRARCHHLMVMDDLADRVHDCDLLLDPSLGRTQADYAGLTPPGTVTLLGPKFALLRPEFAELRAESLARRTEPQLRHLLITMGGVDKDNATGRVLDALDVCGLPPDIRITAVMGPHSPWLAQVKERAVRMHVRTQVLVGVRDMARLMTDSDLAIGAAGGTSWERCCMGLPAIQLVLAENQKLIAEGLDAAGAAVSTTPEMFQTTFPGIVNESMCLKHLLKRGHFASLVSDGLGVQRVVANLLGDFR